MAKRRALSVTSSPAASISIAIVSSLAAISRSVEAVSH